jgi:hypothetical protein
VGRPFRDGAPALSVIRHKTRLALSPRPGMAADCATFWRKTSAAPGNNLARRLSRWLASCQPLATRPPLFTVVFRPVARVCGRAGEQFLRLLIWRTARARRIGHSCVRGLLADQCRPSECRRESRTPNPFISSRQVGRVSSRSRGSYTSSPQFGERARARPLILWPTPNALLVRTVLRAGLLEPCPRRMRLAVPGS